LPGGLDGVRADARAHRAVLGHVVGYLVQDADIRQFLDIGTGVPKENNVHEVAQRGRARIACRLSRPRPIVLAHTHALLRGTPEGVTRYIYRELREPEAILRASAETLDFTRPIAVLLFGILHFFSEDDDPAGVVRRLVSPLAPGRLRRDYPPGAGRGGRRAVRRPGEHRVRSRAAAAVTPAPGRPGTGAAADVVRGRRKTADGF
jgi:S-adenosyl methyltransferase